jgi:hypothetical protein
LEYEDGKSEEQKCDQNIRKKGWRDDGRVRSQNYV